MTDPAAPCPTCSGPIRETVGMVCQTCGTNYAQMGRRHDCSDCTHPADGWHLHIVRRNDRVIWRCSEGNRSMTVDPGDRITYEYAENGATMGCPR